MVFSNQTQHMSLKIKKNISLSGFTSFKIGGPAKYFVEVRVKEDLKEAYNWGEKHREKIFILGGGTNLLFLDSGFNGLVIKISFSDFIFPEVDYEYGKKYAIRIGSGVSMFFLARETVKKGLKGLEWAGGLPGTLGGAISGNAGAFRFDMAQVVKSVEIFQGGNFRTISKEECVFAYRASLFRSILSNAVIISAELEMEAGNKEEAKKEMEGYLKHRMKSQPLQPSAGCVFKNFLFEKEENLNPRLKEALIDNFRQYKKAPAAWLIENSGLKGAKIGDAIISNEHCNFIVNTKQATAKDVLALIKKVKEEVYQKFGVDLKEEVQIVK